MTRLSRFLIQSNNFDLSKDLNSLDNLLRTDALLNKFHLCNFVSIDELEDCLHHLSNIDDIVPVGSVEFVEKFLNLYARAMGYSVTDYHIKPLNIPKFLQKDKYLLRDYNIKPYSKLGTGMSFRKCADRLGGFASLSNYKTFIDICSNSSPSDLYVTSSEVNILSEYRVFVLDGIVQAVQYVSGSRVIFPANSIISDIVDDISKSTLEIGAYAIDLGVTPNGINRGFSFSSSKYL